MDNSKLEGIKEEKAHELGEKELGSVTGGATQNRYDPNVCPARNRAEQSCWGIFGTYWCDHYRREYNSSKSSDAISVYDVECVMGCFKYEEKRADTPMA